MKISLHSNYGIFTEQQGYWTASKNIVESLITLGHEVTYNDPTADVMFNFCMPHDYVSYPGQYTIGYTPWESSGMQGILGGRQRPPQSLAGFGIGYSDDSKPNQTWPEMIMETCDEFWTTNSLGYGWFKDGGVSLPGKVFPHGIDHDWQPVRHGGNGPITFLHVGEPATRKAGQMVFDAFKELYGNNPDYRLIIKGVGASLVREWRNGQIGPPEEWYKNVTVDIRDLTKVELMSMYASADCLVYPSWGEGFGFIPLQALASGLPVIMTAEWADYVNNTPGVLTVKTELVESPWQDIHPGNMLKPDIESIKTRMEQFSKFRHAQQSVCYANAQNIHDEYDWVRLTENAFKDLSVKFS